LFNKTTVGFRHPVCRVLQSRGGRDIGDLWGGSRRCRSSRCR
jgi:hypothetical protein